MATSAMNGAIYDSTFNLFYKLKYAHTYDAMLATPMDVPDVAVGEITWALTRGLIYAIGFMVVMLLLGLVSSPDGAARRARVGAHRLRRGGPGDGSHDVRAHAGRTSTWCSSSPCRCSCSAPRSTPSRPTPSHCARSWRSRRCIAGVHLLRGLTTGTLDPMMIVDVVYLLVLGFIGLSITSRRLGKLLLK